MNLGRIWLRCRPGVETKADSFRTISSPSRKTLSAFGFDHVQSLGNRLFIFEHLLAQMDKLNNLEHVADPNNHLNINDLQENWFGKQLAI
jgi:hypothetical protein